MMAETSSLLSHLAGSRALPAPAPSSLEQEVVALFDELRAPLLRYLLSLRIAPSDAEEIVQEAFLLLFRHLRAEKRRDNLQGWLFGVAHNLALKHFTRVRREAGGDAALTAPPDVEPDPEERLQMLELQHNLLAVVRALPEQDQRCLSLRAEGLRYRDIARILGISLGSVANSVSRSLSRLSRGSTGRSFTDAR